MTDEDRQSDRQPNPPNRPAAGRVIDAARQLLDRQIVDRDGDMAGKVDDLELTRTDEGHLIVTAILSGPGALAPRLEGRLGAAWAALFRRLHPSEQPEPARIAIAAVTGMDDVIRINQSRHDLDTDRFERWTVDNLIGRIPGSGHQP